MVVSTRKGLTFFKYSYFTYSVLERLKKKKKHAESTILKAVLSGTRLRKMKYLKVKYQQF